MKPCCKMGSVADEGFAEWGGAFVSKNAKIHKKNKYLESRQ